MKYMIDFIGMKRHGYLSERKRGQVVFENVQQAQEFAASVFDMLDYFDADCGDICCWRGDWELVWELKVDRERVNVLPIDYRIWREAFFAVEEYIAVE